MFCDNNGVIKNTSIPESILMKKHNAIHKAAAARILQVGKEDGSMNLVANLFTKVLNTDCWHALCDFILY